MNNSNAFKSPQFWPTWLGIFILRLLAMLPFKPGLLLGRLIGSALYYLIPKRRKVVEVNSRLCFPEFSEPERQQFVKDVFRNNGIGIIETAWSYWGNKESIKNRTTYLGFEHLEKALEEGRGVIILGAHYSCLDLGIALCSLYGKPLVTMYREHNNPLMEQVIHKGRSTWCEPVERKKLREIVRYLRKNYLVWYGPDQDFGAKKSVFVPFFGHTAATITATTKMARLNKSPMLALQQRRNEDDSGYTVEICPVDGFPSGDEIEDARLVNQAIEAGIRKAPSQYMWVHKRFKTQPDGEQKLYKKAGC
ncbi:MAG: LpxL/LpxP family Kdo(2)-lipid IV(A) lauroyl/palmitoleoyl acyltransferase [Neptuniibacter sp.]|nr:LpxL/LpxP family Kdo(2)-lipid IV(A) lauroyl/palmitoleoyl acyltransferase [Neptuniibacter sp.]